MPSGVFSKTRLGDGCLGIIGRRPRPSFAPGQGVGTQSWSGLGLSSPREPHVAPSCCSGKPCEEESGCRVLRAGAGRACCGLRGWACTPTPSQPEGGEGSCACTVLKPVGRGIPAARWPRGRRCVTRYKGLRATRNGDRRGTPRLAGASPGRLQEPLTGCPWGPWPWWGGNGACEEMGRARERGATRHRPWGARGLGQGLAGSARWKQSQHPGGSAGNLLHC